jgi:hypothetical protein
MFFWCDGIVVALSQLSTVSAIKTLSLQWVKEIRRQRGMQLKKEGHGMVRACLCIAQRTGVRVRQTRHLGKFRTFKNCRTRFRVPQSPLSYP